MVFISEPLMKILARAAFYMYIATHAAATVLITVGCATRKNIPVVSHRPVEIPPARGFLSRVVFVLRGGFL